MREIYAIWKGILPSIFLLVLPVSIFAQLGGAWQPSNYDGIPQGDRHTIIYDEFEDNRNNWNLESSYLEMRIENSDFYLRNLQSRPIVKRKQFDFDISGNYEVEIRMRYVRGIPTLPIGLTFGRDAKGNEYNFYFKPDGEYKVSRYFKYQSQDIKPWSFHSSLNKYSANTLTVRKVADQWYFFINRQLVHHSPAYPLYGHDFGITISGETAIEVDYLRIEELHPLDEEGPEIHIDQPFLSGNIVATSDEYLEIKGLVEDPSGVSELAVNGYAIKIGYRGSFYARLHVGARADYFPVNITAKDKWGNESETRFQVRYTAQTAFTPAPSTDNRPFGDNASSATAWSNSTYNSTKTGGTGGTSYLLLIGVNNYTYWGNLNNAVKDCHDLEEVLTDQYQFDQGNVFKLLNSDATREAILETFERLQDIVTEEDNLLIYYAGHGYYDNDSELGYWVPVNARQRKIPDYIRNSTIHDYLKTIRSKHTLLIADACYAGSLFVSRGGILNENYKSRWAFTSGDIEKVWDGAPGQNSPFAAYLINYLKTNRKQKLMADELIEAVKLRVARNTQQTPKGDALRNAGDEGGVFVFYRR